MIKPLIKTKLENLPLLPGCYLMKDERGKIIYVGKAKELRNRVGSYFYQHHTGKTATLVESIDDFDIIVTSSEQEALLLEISLIQKHYPQFNILLKDGKTYPYIVLTKEKHPRLIISRYYKKKLGKAFGPFPTPGVAYRIVGLLNQLFPLRKCQNVPGKACLYYHIGQCLAPCVNEVSVAEYLQIAEKISAFFHGDVGDLKKIIKERMSKYAEQLEFEEAGKQKKILSDIDEVLIRQKIDLKDAIDIDVIGYQIKNDYLSIMILLYRSGTLVGKTGEVIPLYGQASDMILSYLMQYYKINPLPKFIVASIGDDRLLLEQTLGCKIKDDTKGKYKEMLTLAAANAIKQLEEHFIYASNFTSDEKINLLKQLADLLNMPLPRRIELFDCSRMHGENGVAAMVVFVNCEAYKKGYRKYKLSENAVDDDFQGIKEAVGRRLQSDNEKADLIIVDGGKMQISAALQAMSELNIFIPVCGLSKDDRHRTSKLINQELEEISLDRYGALFHFLTRMQDEVHRFTISYFRQKKTRSMTGSILDKVPGIGEKRRRLLLATFGSIAAIKDAGREELRQYLPPNLVEALFDLLNQEDKQ